MYRILLAAPLLIVAEAAHAKIPFFNAVCGDGVEVHADEGGPIYINGKEGKLTVFNDAAYEAKHNHVAIDVTINPDGSPMVTYTGKHGANGVCTVSQ
jgi:hypothetical protein